MRVAANPMPVQDLLKQVSVEHATLQSKYDQAVVEIETLRERLALLGETYAASTSPPQRLFAAEANHSAVPSGDGSSVEPSSTFEGSAKLPTKNMAMEDIDGKNRKSAMQHLNKVRDSAFQRNADFMTVGRTASLSGEDDFVEPDSLKGIARAILMDNKFEMLIAIVVICNIVVMWIDTDVRARDGDMPTWLTVSAVVYFFVYCIEFFIRVLAFGAKVFADHWNKLDFGIIMIDVVTVFVRIILGNLSDNAQMGSAKMLRLFRLFRLARIVKILRFAPELQLLIHGFYGAAKALLFASGMLGIVIVIWAFVYVETIEPYIKEMTEDGDFNDCPDCIIIYSSMWQAALTLIQKNVAGDSWGVVNLEVIRKYPETTPVIFASLATILLGLMNLILTVIVDAAARSKEEAQHYILEQKEIKFHKIKAELIGMMENMDHDGSGELTYDELKFGFENNQDFAHAMALMDITLEDLSAVFMIMDEDRSGTVTYTEFVNNLYKLKQQDTDTTLFFIKGYVYDIRFKVRNDLKRMMENVAKDTTKTQQHVEEMFGMVLEHVDAMKAVVEHVEASKQDGQLILPDSRTPQIKSAPQEQMPKLVKEGTTESGADVTVSSV